MPPKTRKSDGLVTVVDTVTGATLGRVTQEAADLIARDHPHPVEIQAG